MASVGGGLLGVRVPCQDGRGGGAPTALAEESSSTTPDSSILSELSSPAFVAASPLASAATESACDAAPEMSCVRRGGGRKRKVVRPKQPKGAERRRPWPAPRHRTSSASSARAVSPAMSSTTPASASDTALESLKCAAMGREVMRGATVAVAHGARRRKRTPCAQLSPRPQRRQSKQKHKEGVSRARGAAHTNRLTGCCGADGCAAGPARRQGSSHSHHR